MVVAYLRVSTEKQTLANQQNEIAKYTDSRNLHVDRWVTEIVSGKKRGRDRKLSALVRRMKPGDTLIVTELSRLSRTLTDIMAIVGELLRKEVHLYNTGYEVVPDIISSNRLAGYHRKFIECCDQIVYSIFRVPMYVRDDFARQVRALKGKQPLVRYVMAGEYIADPINLESLFDLRQSIEYIRRSGFRVLTDKLPQDMLEKWLDNADLPQNYMEFGVLEEAGEVFSRKDTRREHYLLYKVFTAAYIVCRHLLTDPDSGACKEINSRFRQFRRMLEVLAEHRRKGIDIGRFDLLDFDNYDEIFNQFGWADRLEKSVTRLCDSEPGSNLFSTNGQTE